MLTKRIVYSLHRHPTHKQTLLSIILVLGLEVSSRTNYESLNILMSKSRATSSPRSKPMPGWSSPWPWPWHLRPSPWPWPWPWGSSLASNLYEVVRIADFNEVVGPLDGSKHRLSTTQTRQDRRAPEQEQQLIVTRVHVRHLNEILHVNVPAYTDDTRVYRVGQ